MTNYSKSFDESQYVEVPKRAAEIYTEEAKSLQIPLITSTQPNRRKYRYTSVAAVKNVGGASVEVGEDGLAADELTNYVDWDLYFHRCDINIKNEDIANYGIDHIAQKKEMEIRALAEAVDTAVFHGPKNSAGIQIAEGLIGQVTSVQNLNGTDSVLTTKGDVWKGILKLVEAIPFAMRESSPPMLLYLDPTCYSKIIDPNRIYQEQNEWSLIYQNLFSPQAANGYKFSDVIITEKILAEAADNTDGENADTVDVSGTNSRIMIIVPDERWVARVTSSEGFHFVGEKASITQVHQLYGWRGRACAFNAYAVQYSESIVWA